jgi:hypothetical protein
VRVLLRVLLIELGRGALGAEDVFVEGVACVCCWGFCENILGNYVDRYVAGGV